jgi:hypothetical protein
MHSIPELLTDVIEPESDPSTWPAWTDNWYWVPTDADGPAEGPGPAPCPLCGELAEPSDLERFGCCMWCRAGSDAEPSPHRYTPSEFERIARVAAAPHLD